MCLELVEAGASVAGVELSGTASNTALHSRSRTNFDGSVDEENRQNTSTTKTVLDVGSSGGGSLMKHGAYSTPHCATSDHRPTRCSVNFFSLSFYCTSLCEADITVSSLYHSFISVCLSVLSETRWYCVRRARLIIKILFASQKPLHSNFLSLSTIYLLTTMMALNSL